MVERKELPLRLVTFEDAESFLNRCTGWLLDRNDIHNMLYSSALLIARRSTAFTGPYWFGAIEDDNGAIVACGNHNLPNGVYMSEAPENMLDAVYDSIVDAVGLPHRIMAPQSTAKRLAERCSETSDVLSRFHERWHTYRVDDVARLAIDVPGRLRAGRNEEAGLIAEWGRAYGQEDPAPLDVASFLIEKLSDGDLYVWDDHGARSILTLSGRVGKGIRISSVYTPPEFRRRGYASAAVGAVSRAELRSDREFVVLSVTDDNPAARLYQRLGFRRIGSRDCFLIDTSAQPRRQVAAGSIIGSGS